MHNPRLHADREHPRRCLVPASAPSYLCAVAVPLEAAESPIVLPPLTMRWLAPPFILLAACSLIAGCDGFITVRGQVLSWDNAPAGAGSQILIDRPVPDGVETSPLPGALAVVFTGLPEELERPFADSVRTDADGSFVAEVGTAPVRHPFLVRVVREGYQAAEVTPEYGDAKRFVVTVLLVPE